jgi:hypothetical protein
VQVFDDTKDEEKAEPLRDDELEKTYELRRYALLIKYHVNNLA